MLKSAHVNNMKKQNIKSHATNPTDLMSETQNKYKKNLKNQIFPTRLAHKADGLAKGYQGQRRFASLRRTHKALALSMTYHVLASLRAMYGHPR